MKKIDTQRGINELLERKSGNEGVKKFRKTDDFIEQEFNLNNVSYRLGGSIKKKVAQNRVKPKQDKMLEYEKKTQIRNIFKMYDVNQMDKNINDQYLSKLSKLLKKNDKNYHKKRKELSNQYRNFTPNKTYRIENDLTLFSLTKTKNLFFHMTSTSNSHNQLTTDKPQMNVPTLNVIRTLNSMKKNKSANSKDSSDNQSSNQIIDNLKPPPIVNVNKLTPLNFEKIKEIKEGKDPQISRNFSNNKISPKSKNSERSELISFFNNAREVTQTNMNIKRSLDDSEGKSFEDIYDLDDTIDSKVSQFKDKEKVEQFVKLDTKYNFFLPKQKNNKKNSKLTNSSLPEIKILAYNEKDRNMFNEFKNREISPNTNEKHKQNNKSNIKNFNNLAANSHINFRPNLHQLHSDIQEKIHSANETSLKFAFNSTFKKPKKMKLVDLYNYDKKKWVDKETKIAEELLYNLRHLDNERKGNLKILSS